MHWFTTRRSRALKRRLSGSEVVDEEFVAVVLGTTGVVVVAVEAVVPVVFAGVVAEP